MTFNVFSTEVDVFISRPYNRSTYARAVEAMKGRESVVEEFDRNEDTDTAIGYIEASTEDEAVMKFRQRYTTDVIRGFVRGSYAVIEYSLFTTDEEPCCVAYSTTDEFDEEEDEE